MVSKCGKATVLAGGILFPIHIIFLKKDGAYTKDKQHRSWKGRSNHEPVEKHVTIQHQFKIVDEMLR